MPNIDELITQAFENRISWVKNKKVEYKAIEEILIIAEKILPYLTEELNRLHRANYKNNFYQIILGPWLLNFLAVIYDRYELSKEMLHKDEVESGEEITAIIPLDTYQALKLSETRRFNDQVIFDIINAKKNKLKRIYEITTFQKLLNSDFDNTINIKNKSHIKQLFLNKLCSKTMDNNSIVITLSALSPKLQATLFLRNRNIRPIYPFQSNLKQRELSLSSEVRAGINLNFNVKSEFEEIIQTLLPNYIPSSFIEGFEALTYKAKSYGSFPKAIILSTEMYSRYESFMIWVAQSEAMGTKICTMQHGGDYGLHRRCETVFTEINPYHKFYSWGWNWKQFKTSKDAIVAPMPSLHLLSQRTFKHKIANTQRLVYVTTAKRKYTRRFMGTVAHVYNSDGYFSNQLQFYRNLNKPIWENLEIRLYKDDYRDIARNKWLMENSLIKFDLELNFTSSIANSCCVLLDHLSTTWLEAINLDKPTIIFIDPSEYDFTDEIKEIITEMHSSSILHYTPESAAKHLIKVESDITTWWYSKGVRNSLEMLKKNLMIMPKNSILMWHEELKSLQ